MQDRPPQARRAGATANPIATPLNPLPHRRRFTLGIRAWVLVASMVAVMPLLGFAGWIVVTLEQRQHAEDDRALVQRTQSLALAVKRRLDRAAIELDALAVSRATTEKDFASVYEQAVRLLARQPDAVAIVFARHDGLQVFSTLHPYGSPLPPANAVRFDSALFDQGVTVYSPVFVGAISKRQVMAVSVPVEIGGRIDYSISLTLPIEAPSAVLRDQVLPDEWTAAVIDPDLVIAGRSGNVRLVGQPVSGSLRHAIEAQQPCPFVTRTYAGVELSSCTAVVPGSAWRVAIGVPTETYEHGLRSSLLKLLAAGIASIVLGTAGAWLIANLIRAQVKLLAAAASPDRAHEHHPTHASPIREIATVGEGLRHARRREDDLALQLSDAKHDALTGLAGRRLFHELIARDLRHASGENDRIALLFLDLDGFKAINDRLGHDAGDDLLRAVASTIRSVVRPTDIASRPGGDEFVVYLRGPRDQLPDLCADVAQRLVERVAKLCDGLGCSAGVAIGRPEAGLVGDLLASADRLMLQAKGAGKGRYRIAADDS